jgi:hypothetical protein
MRFGLALFIFIALSAAADAPPPPSAAEQAALIGQVREAVLAYDKSLPDFICTQVTRRSTASTNHGAETNWKLQDTLTIRLTYFGQKENYRVVSVDGKPADRNLGNMPGFKAVGDFGTMPANVFALKSQARFTFSRWDRAAGRQAAVFSYRIERVNSSFGANFSRLIYSAHYVFGAEGEVWIDAERHLVIHLTIHSIDMPAKSPAKDVRLALDYGYQKVGERDFLLPLRSVTLIVLKGQQDQLDTTFGDYRKFSVDSEINYGGTGDKK